MPKVDGAKVWGKIAHDTGYWELVCGAKETQFSLFCSFTITLLELEECRAESWFARFNLLY
jgi:hypothetical protein